MPTLVNYEATQGTGENSHYESSDRSSDEESNDSFSASNTTPKKYPLTDNNNGTNNYSSPESSMASSPAAAATMSSPANTNTVFSQWQLFAQKESNLEALLQHSFDKISELMVSASPLKTCIQRNTANNQYNTAAQQEGQSRQDGTTIQGDEDNDHNGEVLNGNEDNSTSSSAIIRQVVAKEKAANALLKQEYAILESKHKDSQMQIEHLKETISKQQDEIHQTEKEVQQAHQETQKYQAQAKTSQNKHEALAMQLHNLQVVVQETKKSSQLLLDQQDELTHMARSMEEQYFQTQATNMQQQRQHSHLQQEHQALLQDKEKLQNRVKHLQNDLKAKERQIQQHWQQSVKTLEQKQVWNVQRIEALEDELQESKTLTLQALTTTQKSEATSQQLQTELATLQSTLDECQQEYKSQREQLQAQLDESRQKCQSKEHSNQKLVAQMKQVQHQGQDFRLELQAMEQILKEQHKRRNKGGSTTSIISPATNSNTTTNQQQVLCAEKCRACQLPYALGLPQHYATISSPTNHHPNAAKTNTKTITPTTAALTKAATFRLVQSTSATTTTTTSPLYVCLHCVQAIAQPILASTSSKRKNGGKSSSRGRKRRSAPGEKIDCMKKAVPVGSGIGNSDKQAVDPIPGGDDGTNNSRKKHCFMTAAEESMVPSTTSGTGTDAAKVATNGQEASLHLSPKTRLTSAVARMVGPPSSNQVISK